MATTTRFDAIIIGAGQAGPSLAERLARAGHKVAIIERHAFGGTCVNTGCMPTKAMVASARAAHMARRAADFGVMIDGAITVDMKRVRARKQGVIDHATESLEKWLRSTPNCTVIKGAARFESANEISVGDERLTAEKIFVNVGGRAFIPNIPGIENVPYLTNANVMDLDALPQHLVIVGGGPVGLEFAQIFRRFGSEVTIVEMSPRLVPREDEDVSTAIREILEGEGVHVRVDAKCIRVEKNGDSVKVAVDCTSGEPDIVGSHLLLAIGRKPNTDDLGLERAGVAIDARGYVVVDDALRSNIAGIWALGECNGRGAFTHTAYNDFEIVAANLLEGDNRRVTDRIQTYGLFIDPPLGRIGMTEAEVVRSGRPALIGTRPMTRVNRAVERGETQGFIKILVDAETKQILGASILGIEGDEAVHLLLDAMYAKAPYTVIQRAVHIHPTVSELIPTVLGSLEPLKS